MAETAFQTQFRQQMVDGFEVRQSYLRSAVTTEAVIKGNTATFLIADSGGATAVSRGANGRIPSRADNLTQTSATLVEWHDKPVKTGFNIFAGQGDQKRLMQETCMAVINRKIDSDIIAQLDTATVQVSATAATASVQMVTHAKTILGVNEVDTTNQDKMFAVVTPAFMGYLMNTTEFSSADYVEVKPFTGPARRFLRWYGINWIEHPNLTGVGTSSEKCYMFHKDAIGHAADKNGMQSVVGYDEEDDYSFARCSIFMGSKLLQSSGIVQILHDGSGLAAA